MGMSLYGLSRGMRSSQLLPQGGGRMPVANDQVLYSAESTDPPE